MYEYAILCGATFVLWALWQWLCAANTPVNRRKALAFHLAFGSLCMALVAGCRPQMVLFAVLALPILWPRYITEKHLVHPPGRRGSRCVYPARCACGRRPYVVQRRAVRLAV